MGRKKSHGFSRKFRSHVDLDGSLDTSSTQLNTMRDDKAGYPYKNSEHIPPPFKGEDGGGYVKKSEISLTWRVVGVVATLFVSVGVPVTWFASKINNDIDNLNSEVGRIKERAEKLWERAIRGEERLNSAERSIDFISRTLQQKVNEKPDKKIPSANDEYHN